MTVKGAFMRRSTRPDHADLRARTAVLRPGAPLAAAVTALMLLACLLVAAASAGVAGAGAKPGKPLAKTPKGTITSATPTFTWAKAKGAKKYEVRVYQGSKLVVKKTGVTKTSWKTTKALPKAVALKWKVRGSNSAGAGPWSSSVAFKISAPSSAKAITAFGFQSLNPPVPGAIDQSARTISLTVPFGTNVTHLVATFTTTGASVKVGSTTQASGTTANDFTNPVTYTVTAGDSSRQDYVVTVTVQEVHVGDAYGGGIVAYMYQSGDPGYVAGETHGLIVSSGDVNSMGIQWWNGSYVSTGATGTAVGTGSANTDAIIATQGGTATSYAAGLARAYTGGGHSDWYLPSKDELNKVYLNKAAIGGSFDALVYWTSSEASAVSAYSQNFSNGHAAGEVKQDQQGVRAVRSF
jgi:hypothetical protein